MIAAVVVTFAFIFYLFSLQIQKSIKITSPLGGEEWTIGDTYQVTWKSKGVDKVGIVLFYGEEAKWIAKDVNAGAGSFEWKIYPGQQYGDNYWIAVFEYPWRKGNKIAYSDGAFAVTFPELASCDTASIQAEWPFIPNDLPNLRRVFITEDSYRGDLGGFEGADQKCQAEAQKQGFSGTWRAFLGGDSDQDMAVARINGTPRKSEGVFIEAKPVATLLRGATCHRLLGKNFSEFVEKFSAPSVINQEKLENDFFQNLSSVWMGRLDNKSKKNCTDIATALLNPYKPLQEKYSLTTTCQNWTKSALNVDGYPVQVGQPKPAFPTCYTPEGKSTDAVVLGGLAIGLTGGGTDSNAFTPYQGKSCDTAQKLICIEE